MIFKFKVTKDLSNTVRQVYTKSDDKARYMCSFHVIVQVETLHFQHKLLFTILHCNKTLVFSHLHKTETQTDVMVDLVCNV